MFLFCFLDTQEFEKCDFGPIRDYLEAQKVEKKAATKEEKDKVKAEKEVLQRNYGFALLDGNRIEKVDNGGMRVRERRSCSNRVCVRICVRACVRVCVHV